MSVLLVSYDLNRPGQNYAELTERIKATGTWAKPLESTWLVKTPESPKEIYDRLSPVLDAGDRILIMDVTGTTYWGYLSREVNDWISQNVG